MAVPRLLVPVLTVAVLLLTGQAYFGGLHLDDWHQREVLQGEYEFSTGASPYLEFFTFATGNAEENQQLIDRGVLPWWSDDQLQFTFLRPLSVLTHQVDILLWPDHLGPAHLHSVLWFVACLYAASLVYRRCGVTTYGVCLAITFFALDDVHGTTIYWLANRNHLIAGTFALLAFNEHLKWQQQKNRLAAIRSMVLFAVSLLSAELGTAYGGLVFAWAVFLHSGTLFQRFTSLLPGGCVGIIWFAFYRAGGFGARFSGQYVDPAGDPVGFVIAIAERVPLFFSVMFGIGSTDLYSFGTLSARPFLWLGAVVVCGFMFAVMARHGRHDRHLKFWLLATFMSTLPICAGNLMDRIMLMATFAGHGLISRLVELIVSDVAEWKKQSSASHRGRIRFSTGVCVYLLLAHIVGSCFLLPFRIFASNEHRKAIESAVANLDDAGPIDDSDLVILNPPDTMFTWHLAKIRRGLGQPVPRNVRVLCSALVPVIVVRTDDRTLVVRPQQPFLRSGLSDLYRSTPLSAGWHRSLTGIDIDVEAVSSEGDPTEIKYTFDRPLEAENLTWLQWQGDRFVRFTPPPTGAPLNIAAQVDPMWIAVNPLRSLLGQQGAD
ncbi:MAG: hypothetical protein GY903_12675 [Fuerstiella sp.]|nr:hypothetical protein [Fuerstiella sp.]MCP4855338.1 hypothetical protein [Fuerstiella sp.]